jgi:hypothetical protein
LLSRSQLGYAAARYGRGPVRCWYFLKPRHLQRTGTTQPMAYRSAGADYLDTEQVTLKLFVYHSFECDFQVYGRRTSLRTRYITRKGSGSCYVSGVSESWSTAIPSLVHPVLSPISVTSALIDPRFSSLPLVLPLSFIGALSKCDATSVQVIAEFWPGTGNRKARNSYPFNQSYIILAHPLSSTPCLGYHGLCLLRRSFLDLAPEVWRFLVLVTRAITAKVETSVTARPAEQQAEDDAPITIGKRIAM